MYQSEKGGIVASPVPFTHVKQFIYTAWIGIGPVSANYEPQISVTKMKKSASLGLTATSQELSWEVKIRIQMSVLNGGHF